MGLDELQAEIGDVPAEAILGPGALCDRVVGEEADLERLLVEEGGRAALGAILQVSAAPSPRRSSSP